MESFSGDIVQLLQFLLPGFLSAWIFYGFTAFEKPNQFERVIQALIFTIFVQASSVAAAWVAKLSGYSGIEKSLSGAGALPFSLASATVLGFVAAYFANSDRFHALIRWMRISGETSYASEWYRAFAAELTWVVLHLKDGRRLYGYPHEWPSSPDRGHIAIEKPTWLDVSDGAEPKPDENVRELLIPVTSIAMVEFMVRQEDEQRKQPTK